MAEPVPLHTVRAELQGTVVSIEAAAGSSVRASTVICLIESMKLHHEVRAGVEGSLAEFAVPVGATVMPGDVLARVDTTVETAHAEDESAATVPTGLNRPDLAEVIARHRLGTDDARPESVARRRSVHRRTTRENIEDLVDAGSFVEYGPLAIAAQLKRRTHDDLITRTPADGMVGGIGTINGHLFPGRDSRAIAVSYDYTVMAGTQGHRNHRKKDKLFELAKELELPVVFYTEGGGGRPGDTDTGGVTGLDCLAFLLLAELSGTVPIVGINAGYCFAGNAAILGCCDVVIATRDSNIGMAGPAMIEGGGLGVFAPTTIGPIDVQSANGVVDLVADDEAHATLLAKRYLSYFQGALTNWSCRDQAELRDVVPLDRLRGYDVRAALHGIFDDESVLELRSQFGTGMITALARIEGHPVGVIANNPAHLAGAIDSDGADKAARFMQLCDAHGLPIVTLVDTPGMMVGPDVEATALVRHCSRLFVTGANLSVPTISVVLRKAYGLGAQAMMGGSTKAPLACISWPTGEFGPMGLEGAVRLGYRAELDACADDDSRAVLFAQLVDKMYEHGKALSIAEWFEIDDVIDPADTRRWLTSLLEAAPHARGLRPNIDTW
ncbi:MAG TPA: carboxyl transferase domain-containing protein [Ilumatobacter sp.]|nr:carboxyl transferase domain-containing protein [Ilumatobacter sp.]